MIEISVVLSFSETQEVMHAEVFKLYVRGPIGELYLGSLASDQEATFTNTFRVTTV